MSTDSGYPEDAARACGVNTKNRPTGLDLLIQAVTECQAELECVAELLASRGELRPGEVDFLPSVVLGIKERLDVAASLAEETR